MYEVFKGVPSASYSWREKEASSDHSGKVYKMWYML